jgi:tRNA pseudouridine55 synthase
MYSAKKVAGKKLYEHARKGEVLERTPLKVTISKLDLLGTDDDAIRIRVVCSAGTYIRTLAEDIGEALGSGAHLASLRRTASGAFRLAEASTLEALASLTPEGRRTRLLGLPRLLAGLPRAELDGPAEARLRSGQELRLDEVGEGLCALFRRDGEVIGLGRGAPGGLLKAVRLTRSVGQAAEKHR